VLYSTAIKKLTRNSFDLTTVESVKF